jgi:hypothetical protein
MKATMKATVIKGLTVLGIGAVIFGIGAATPAKADGWHDRRRVEIVPSVRVVLGVGPVQVVAPCAPVVVVDQYRGRDWRWRRDHRR